MAYSELVKDFSKVRAYLRQFYVYGFKSREEYTAKSLRTYDNERRRVESWLGEYMHFSQGANGKSVFLSVDSRALASNPLYKAFKAKSFTDNDIMLHFYILDLLSADCSMTAAEILEALTKNYFGQMDAFNEPDLSTVRKKLKEYAELGLLTVAKKGNKLYYSRSQDNVDLPAWENAIRFYAETAPVGVLGSTLADKIPAGAAHERFNYKHNYILNALDSEILTELFLALGEQRIVTLENVSLRTGRARTHTVLPLQIYISTQTGKQYLLCYHYKFKRIFPMRLDALQAIVPGEREAEYGHYLAELERVKEHLWGVSLGDIEMQEKDYAHVEMQLYVGEDEQFIVQRLEREKRCGQVKQLDVHHYAFTADVYDAHEMLPWVRTFIGRIVSFTCSDKKVEKLFYDDLEAMNTMYGVNDDAVQ